MITGKDLIAWGINRAGGWARPCRPEPCGGRRRRSTLRAIADAHLPPPVIEVRPYKSAGFHRAIEAETPDEGELPSACRNAETVVRQISDFDLAEVVDHIDHHGSIMAGNWQTDFHRQRKAAKKVRDRERGRGRSSGRRG